MNTTTTKKTERDFYTKIMTALADDAEIVAFCEKKIGQLDAKKIKAKERAAEKVAEPDELMTVVEALLTDEFQTTTDVMAQIEGEDITQYKINWRLTQLVKAGKAEKTEVAIPATETSKARKVMGYRLLAD